MRSPAYEPGPYSPNESQLEKFLDWYIDRLTAYVGASAEIGVPRAIAMAHATS